MAFAWTLPCGMSILPVHGLEPIPRGLKDDCVAAMLVMQTIGANEKPLILYATNKAAMTANQ